MALKVEEYVYCRGGRFKIVELLASGKVRLCLKFRPDRTMATFDVDPDEISEESPNARKDIKTRGTGNLELHVVRRYKKNRW